MSGRSKNLARRYGFFKCSSCGRLWESSLVFVDKVTNDVPYGQECQRCKISCKPYRIERIKCRECGFSNCVCKNKPGRHIDVRKTHRRDLCEKCKAGDPCSSATPDYDNNDFDDDDDYYNNAHSHPRDFYDDDNWPDDEDDHLYDLYNDNDNYDDFPDDDYDDVWRDDDYDDVWRDDDYN